MGGRKSSLDIHHTVFPTTGSHAKWEMAVYNITVLNTDRKGNKALFYEAVSRHTLLILGSSQNKLKGQPPAKFFYQTHAF
jgi:hypothetical protein